MPLFSRAFSLNAWRVLSSQALGRGYAAIFWFLNGGQQQLSPLLVERVV